MRLQKSIRVTFLLLACACLSAAALAQSKVLTPELILTIRTVVDVQMSPDGASIIYQVARPRSDGEPPGSARDQ